MSEWSKVCLGELIKVKHGFAFPGQFITSEMTDRILVTPGNFCIGGGFKQGKFKYFSSHDYPAEYQFLGGELIVTMTDLSKETDTLGYSAVVPSDGKVYLHNQRVGLIEPISAQSCLEFVYWLMRWRDYQEFIVNSASGTSVMHTSPSRICEFEFELPPLPEQKAIASVLSSLDDKIDLLHRQNKTLEAMAETLFRQWFIEEAKEDWAEFELNEFGQIICGKTPSKSNANYFGDDVPFLKIPDMHGKVFITKTTDSLSQLGALSQSKKMVPQNSICVSCIATVGLVCITDCDLQTNQQINSIVPTEPKFLYYLYEVMLGMYDELHNLASGGTATLNLNTGDFSRIKIAKPDDETLLQFNNAIIPLFTKIRCNVRQIQTLENLRDTLLPKLMSGEVRVQYQTEEVA